MRVVAEPTIPVTPPFLVLPPELQRECASLSHLLSHSVSLCRGGMPAIAWGTPPQRLTHWGRGRVAVRHYLCAPLGRFSLIDGAVSKAVGRHNQTESTPRSRERVPHCHLSSPKVSRSVGRCSPPHAADMPALQSETLWEREGEPRRGLGRGRAKSHFVTKNNKMENDGTKCQQHLVPYSMEMHRVRLLF